MISRVYLIQPEKLINKRDKFLTGLGIKKFHLIRKREYSKLVKNEITQIILPSIIYVDDKEYFIKHNKIDEKLLFK